MFTILLLDNLSCLKKKKKKKRKGPALSVERGGANHVGATKISLLWAKKMTACLFLNLPLSSSSAAFTYHTNKNYPSLASHLLLTLTPNQSSLRASRFLRQIKASSASMEAQQSETGVSTPPMKLLFVEMGVGYDQHGSASFAPLTLFSLFLPHLMICPFENFMRWSIKILSF